MSKSETARFIELIREVTVGKTLLTVEHDMGVVFGLADKIAVLVYGEVIAFDVPDAVRANARVQEAYLGSVLADRAGGRSGAEPTMLRARRPARLLRQEPHPARRRHARSAKARSSACSAATARAARPPSRRSWAWSHGEGSVRLRDQEILGQKTFDIAHRGIGYVPENRDIFPKLTVHQNLHARREARQEEAALDASTTCTACSRA